MDNVYLKSKLSNEELLLVNSEVEKNKKSPVVAWLLWWFTGTLGGHRYYFGKTGSAVAMTLITILTLGFGIIITGIWALIDVFSINSWLKNDQTQIESKAIQEILVRKEAGSNNASDDQISPDTANDGNEAADKI